MVRRRDSSLFILLFAVAISAMAQLPSGDKRSSAPESYELVVLTFEDDEYKGGGNMLGNSDWSSLIDDPQYGGPLLYGPNGVGFDNEEDIYWWYDENNTGLYSAINDAYGSYCYWSGGAALSNYVNSSYDEGGYMTQLEAYSPTGKGGHNDSDNFLVCYGYDDDSPFSMDSRPRFSFQDGQPKVIDHLYLALNCYTLHSLAYGDDFSTAATEGDYVNITFEGIDAEGNSTGMVTVPILDPETHKALIGYTKVDLSSLGEISTLLLNMVSNIDNGYGLSVPAYYILDDIAVRVPKEVEPTATAVTLDAEELALTIGETTTLTATVAPENATDKSITWSSSDEAVATVDAEGAVTAVAAGETIIIAACGEVKATCVVTVNKKTQTIEWEQEMADMVEVGTEITLTATSSAGLDITYELTAGTEYASLSGNVIIILADGSIEITATQAGNDENAAAEPVVKTYNLATGIATIAADSCPVTIYTIDGQCVNNNTKKGIYIIQGRKVLVK